MDYVNINDIEAAFLATNTTLQELTLQNNNIHDAGAIAIANMNLNKLSIADNPIGNNGKNALLANTHFIYLDIRDCKDCK